jgi:two-component system NtrC family sensor kinase
MNIGMNRRISTLFGGRLQIILIASFSLVAALTVGLNTLAISRVISDYLTSAEAARVERDMHLADSFYRFQLEDTAAISRRLVLDPLVVASLPEAVDGDKAALNTIDRQITTKISALGLGGTHLIAIVDENGEIILARVVLPDGELSLPFMGGSLDCMPVVQKVFTTGEAQSATEVIPAECLSTVHLSEQARVPLIDTPMASPELFDPREGTAGLALTGISPFKDESGDVVGAAITAYMFNNDFTLVDRIKEAAGVDTVTIFFGDLRVSTNVMTEEGARAVGTRISKEVYDVVLDQGQDYVGEAFVVNDMYITRYKPLHDHEGNVVGSLYVGARKSSFQALVDAFRKQVSVIALVCIVLAGIVAIPIAGIVTRPIVTLVEANTRLANGDMSIRVESDGKGELAVLAKSFNNMVETLQRTQQELVHKEKLASVGQLAAGVAHELNNPLGTILLFSDVMLKELAQDDPRRSDLRLIIDETTRCKTIVADLLNFAREQKIFAEETDLNKLLDNVVNLMVVRPEFEAIQINRDYDPNLPIIQADPAQVQQVFINLINNAADAMPKGGTITLVTRQVDSQWVEILVADTGEGIPEENLSKMFTPFFTTRGPGKGTGLGLSIVYGIIKMHRGQITVQSTVGEGTLFTVTLPTRLPEVNQTVQVNSGNLIG